MVILMILGTSLRKILNVQWITIYQKSRSKGVSMTNHGLLIIVQFLVRESSSCGRNGKVQEIKRTNVCMISSKRHVLGSTKRPNLPTTKASRRSFLIAAVILKHGGTLLKVLLVKAGTWISLPWLLITGCAKVAAQNTCAT